MDNHIIYETQCIICDEAFSSKRAHAQTCSDRCRFIIHKLKENYEEFIDKVDYELYELSSDELITNRNYTEQKVLLDSKGNSMEFIGGFKDCKDEIKIFVLRINTLRYLEVWNDYGNEITHKYFKYH